LPSDLVRVFRDELWVLVTAALPVAELRVAIPLAHSLGMSVAKAYWLSVVGNMLPIPLVLFVLWRFDRQLRQLPVIGKILDWCMRRAMRRQREVERYGAVALALFVAIPLPTTGAWTAAAAAFLFRIGSRYALPAIAAGVLLAGLIVTALTQGISAILP
jgi:uncharacterized membrane protein